MRLKALLGAAVVSATGLMVTGLSHAAKSEVNAEHHKLCSEAKDYAGCVRAMNGESMHTSRQINSQGADIAEGNQCPGGAAYMGGGYVDAVNSGTNAAYSLENYFKIIEKLINGEPVKSKADEIISSQVLNNDDFKNTEHIYDEGLCDPIEDINNLINSLEVL